MYGLVRSLPAWGVWIEIWPKAEILPEGFGHSPHGECGLKCSWRDCKAVTVEVTPRMGSVD